MPNRSKRNEGDWPHVVQALARVGTDPAARFRWLLDFAERDLKADAALEAGRFELLAFVVTRGGASSQPTTGELFVEGLADEPSLFGPDARRAVRKLQVRLRNTLESLRTQRRFRGDVRITEAVWTDDGRLLLAAGGDEAHRFDFAVLKCPRFRGHQPFRGKRSSRCRGPTTRTRGAEAAARRAGPCRADPEELAEKFEPTAQSIRTGSPRLSAMPAAAPTA